MVARSCSHPNGASLPPLLMISGKERFNHSSRRVGLYPPFERYRDGRHVSIHYRGAGGSFNGSQHAHLNEIVYLVERCCLFSLPFDPDISNRF